MSESDGTRVSKFDVLTKAVIPFLIPLAVAGFGVAQYYGQKNAEEQRAQQSTLQAYLDQLGTLLIELDLRTTGDMDVRSFARARTLTTLDALNSERKRRVLRFLDETKLLRHAGLKDEDPITDDCSQNKVPSVPKGKQPVISLKYANLEDVEIGRHGFLGGIDLQQADLANAGLDYANMSNTSLRGTNLFEADLRFTDLSGVDLRGSCLVNANLRGADLTDANVSQEQLNQAVSLEGAIIPDGSKHP